MANKVSVELNANVKGFVDGMNQASESAKKYETDQRKVADSAVNFRKELGQTRKEVMNLAAGYARLDQEAKNSDFGQQMKKQLDAAKQSLSEMVDMQGDLNQEIKNMASDTRVFDTMAESVGILGESVSAAFGAIATFTGNTEDAKKAVAMFTTVQSGLSAVTKIQNALQSQSNTMMAVAKLQTLAAAAATKIKTAAEAKGTIVTKGATAAQAAFNAVAKANPYVLLASAIAAVIAGLLIFTKRSKEAAKATEQSTEALEEAKRATENYKNAIVQNFTALYIKYEDLRRQWVALRTEHEKQKWIQENKTKFKELGLAVKDLKSAEDTFVNNTKSVVDAFKKRAQAAALYDRIKELYSKKAELLLKKEDTEQSIANDAAKNKRHAKAGDEIKDQTYRNSGYGNVNAQGKWVFSEKGANRYNGTDASSNPVVKDIDNQIGSIDSNIDRAVGLIEKLGGTSGTISENAVPTGGGGGGKPSGDSAAISTELQDRQKKVKELTDEYVKLGDVETEEANKRKAEIRDLISQENERINKLKLYQEQAQGKLLGGEVQTSRAELEVEPEVSFSQKLVEEELNAQIEELKVNPIHIPVTADTSQVEKDAKDTKAAWYGAASAMSSAGQALSAIEDPGAKVAGILAEAIASVLAGYAQATAAASSMGPWAWIAFAIAGLATAMTVVSQIKSAGSFAEGGVIGGSSYGGDRLTANVNSGEMILNNRQQKKLFDMLDTNSMPTSGPQNIQVEGVISGTDLLLVQKNTNRVRRKSGTQITF